MPDKQSSEQCQRLQALRITVCCALLVAAVVIGFCTFYFLTASQRALQEARYDALVRKIAFRAKGSLMNKQQALLNLALTVTELLPNSSVWPNAAVPFGYWDSMTVPLIVMAKARTITLAPIITPEQVPAFEQFAYRWLEDIGHPELGTSWFGKGIHAVNTSVVPNVRYHDANGTFGVSHGQNRILMPIVEIADLTNNAPAVMFNQYSEMRRIRAIDHTIACAKASHGFQQDYTNCTATTDVISLMQDAVFRPASLVIYPIHSRDGQLVAIASTVHNWNTVLADAVNDQITGMDMVLAYGTQSYYTFTTVNGKVVYVGPGDLHDRKYDDRGYSFQTTPYGGPEVFLCTSIPRTAG